MKKIGIINSGGDVQGINAVISSIVRSGVPKGLRFVGFIKGWEGILDNKYIDLNIDAIRGISHQGGTILHSVNHGRFAGKGGVGDKNEIPEEILDNVKTNLEKLEIDALIVIGGDGTLSGALQLAEKGVKIVGIPKTIDNDLSSTDQTFGFSTAVNIVVEALDRVHTTAVSHDRVLFVETMGRHTGWIALYSGLAGGADAILIPEIPFSYEGLLDYLRYRKTIGRNYSVVVVSEGAKAVGEDLSTIDPGKDSSEVKIGGITDKLMKKIDELAPDEFEMRNTVLGHIQRGGTPDAEDRILAKVYGTKALDAVLSGEFNKMVAFKDGEFVLADLKEAVRSLKIVTKDHFVYKSAKDIGIYFGE